MNPKSVSIFQGIKCSAQSTSWSAAVIFIYMSQQENKFSRSLSHNSLSRKDPYFVTKPLNLQTLPEWCTIFLLPLQYFNRLKIIHTPLMCTINTAACNNWIHFYRLYYQWHQKMNLCIMLIKTNEIPENINTLEKTTGLENAFFFFVLAL